MGHGARLSSVAVTCLVAGGHPGSDAPGSRRAQDRVDGLNTAAACTTAQSYLANNSPGSSINGTNAPCPVFSGNTDRGYVEVNATITSDAWFSRVLVRADVEIVGLGELPKETVLSGGESGTIIDIAGPDVTVSVSIPMADVLAIDIVGMKSLNVFKTGSLQTQVTMRQEVPQ